MRRDEITAAGFFQERRGATEDTYLRGHLPSGDEAVTKQLPAQSITAYADRRSKQAPRRAALPADRD